MFLYMLMLVCILLFFCTCIGGEHPEAVVPETAGKDVVVVGGYQETQAIDADALVHEV